MGTVVDSVLSNLNGFCGSSSLSSCKYSIIMHIHTLFIKKEDWGVCLLVP